MKLYHFLSEKWGLQSLERQRLKVSTLDDLNDPFELLSVNLNDPELRKIFNHLKTRLLKKMGLLCFSKSWRSPLLWSHYADRHKGVALELEVNDEPIYSINYKNSRIIITKQELQNNPQNDFEIKLLTTKFKEWNYERESRVFLGMNEIYKEGDWLFFDFNNNIKLTGIIAGPLSSLNEKKIKSKLPKGKKIRYIKTRLAFRSFDVVHNKKIKVVTIKNA